MLVLLGALLFGAFLVASTLSYLGMRDSIRQTILNDDLPLTSDNIYSEIQRDLFEPILISSLMANDTFVKDWIREGEADPERIIAYLGQIQRRYGTISSFLVSEETLNYYYPGGILKKVDASNPLDAWYFRVRDMQAPYEINVDPDMANQDAMTIFINYRIVTGDGRYLGATGVGLAVNAVKALMQEYHDRYHRDVYFYDLSGNLVLHSLDRSPADDASTPDRSAVAAFREALKAAAAGSDDPSPSVIGSNGELINFRYIPELKWILAVEQQRDGTRGILLRIITTNFVICLITTLVLLTIIRLTLLRYQRRLEVRNIELQRATDSLASANRDLDTLHREKDEFIGVTVHDLQNPLSGIIGYSDLLLDDPSVKGGAREYVSEISVSANGMLDHIRQLLQLNELESSSNFSISETDVRAALLRAVDQYRAPAAQKDLALEVNVEPEEVIINGNAKAIEDICKNLLSNALKYSPPGGVVTIALKQVDGHVEISFKDRGAGISKEDQKKLFKKFARLTHRPTAGETSTGLGLYIVKQLTERLAGQVCCTSAPGRGSLFTVTLPLPEQNPR